MNKQDINEFYRMKRKFYRKMKNSDVFKNSLVCYILYSVQRGKYSAVKDVKSITDVPLLDDQVRVRINIVVNPKRGKRYKCFNKILQRYLYKKCLETGYEYKYDHDGINRITGYILSGNPCFIFIKVDTSMKILNQLE